MARRLPPLNALLALEAVLRKGSVKQAARELSVTPAAVSQQIRNIERAFGLDLLIRHPRGVSLTVEAERLRPQLAHGFDLLEEAVAPLSHASKPSKVIVSIMPSLGRAWLVPYLPELRARLPHLELVVRTETTLVDFDRDEVGLSIRYCREPERGLVAHRLFGELIFPVCSPALAHGPKPLKTLDDLRAFPLLHDLDAPRHGAVFGWDGWLPSAHARSPAPSFAFSDASLLLDAAEADLGVALGRSPLVLSRLRAGRLVRPLPDARPSERAYFVVTSRRQYRRPPVRDLFDWLTAQSEQFRVAFEEA